MHYLLVYILLSTITSSHIDSLINNYADQFNSECVDIFNIEQSILDCVQFYEIDTSCTVTNHSHNLNLNMRVAIDKETFDIYTIFGTDRDEFNKMISRCPICLTLYDMNEYGRFYLEMTQLYQEFGFKYYFIGNTDRFLELQNEILNNYPDRFKPGLKWSDVESQILIVCDTLDFHNIIFNQKTKTFTLSYYVWFMGNGNFVEYTLEVNRSGRCYLLCKTVLAESLGYYRYLH